MNQTVGLYKNYIKRAQDFFLALFALIVLSPVLIIVAGLVYVKLGSPVFFTQIRPGLHGKPFKLMKFRTMTDAKDASGQLLDDSVRLTSFGKFLRASSLDELPELINIIKGDMAIIGPRPLLMEYLELYNETQRRRHEVRPGLSGLAQVSGRNAITWDERFKKDIEYVDHLSFLLDWKIIVLTVFKVIKKEGISADHSVTMEPFKGNLNPEEEPAL